ncbi:MAG: SPFH domain-containing protein [Clostridiales bacterium]|nr:SPFH domain-containing protein [Clostridiales bacterium]
METMTYVGIGIVGLIIVIVALFSMWKKVPQDRAGVVTGRKKRVITGGGTLLIPFLERMDTISLENIPLNINTTGAMTIQGVPITCSGVAVIKIRNEESSILSAVEQFYTGKEEATVARIRETAMSVLEGKLREIVGKLTVEEIYRDREAFSQQVRDVADSSLMPMGFELIAFTIKEITDQNGYLEALGMPRIAEVQRNARIARAEADRDAQIKIAEAERAGAAAKLQAQAEIARETKDKEVKESAYKREAQTAKAEADAAYDIQKNKMMKEIISTDADAEMLRQQRAQGIASEEKEVEVAREKKNIELAQTKADAAKRMLEEKVINPADAARREVELKAEADKIKAIKLAEAQAAAKKMDAEASATAKKLQSEAEAYQIEVIGKREAEIIKAKGEAEADAIRMKLEAEASGMRAKADAYKEYGQAAVTQMIVETLPAMAKNIAEPFASIDKIMVWDGAGKEGGGAVRIAENVTSTLAAVMDSVKEMTGFDIGAALENLTKNKQAE